LLISSPLFQGEHNCLSNAAGAGIAADFGPLSPYLSFDKEASFAMGMALFI